MALERGDLLLIQFARLPRVGQVKTRLIPALGEEGACELHSELMQHCCRQLLAARLGPVELWLDKPPGDEPGVAACRHMGASIRLQAGRDLGERMYHALEDGLSRYRRVILVGSDCPGIDSDYLRRAEQALANNQLVLGPATDGGYVLIGALLVDQNVFREVEWGGDAVLAKSRANIADLGWDLGILPELADIDRPEDLALWYEGGWR